MGHPHECVAPQMSLAASLKKQNSIFLTGIDFYENSLIVPLTKFPDNSRLTDTLPNQALGITALRQGCNKKEVRLTMPFLSVDHR